MSEVILEKKRKEGGESEEKNRKSRLMMKKVGRVGVRVTPWSWEIYERSERTWLVCTVLLDIR